MAKLYFTHGPMGSSKSAMALMTQYNYEQQGYNVLLLKLNIDTRDGAFIKSRALTNQKPCILFSANDNLKEVLLKEEIKGKKYDAIIVDEAQFLTKSHVEELKDITIYKDINVFCYGLKTNYATQLFEGSKRLCELADSERELKSICKCKNKATVNALKINGKVVKEVLGNCDILIGDTNSKDIYTYEPMCYKCWEEAESFKVEDLFNNNRKELEVENIAQNESFVHKKVEKI